MTAKSTIWAGATAALAIGALAPQASAQERLVFSSLSPGGSTNSIFYNQWADRINETGRGSVKVVVRDGTSIANFINVYDRVQNDVIQIGWALTSLLGNQFPLTEVTTLPFIVEDNAACSVALWRLYKSGLLDKEFAATIPLDFNCFTVNYVHWAKPPKTVDTLSGAKFRVSGKVGGQVIQLLGGTPISLRGGEMYEGLQRGTIDGVQTSWAAFPPYKLWEVTGYHLEAPLGTSPGMHFMSKKKFYSLSKQVRDAVMAHSGEARSREMGIYIAAEANKGRDKVIEGGQKIVSLTAEQRANWKKRTAPVVEEWANGRANGHKAIEMFTALYDDALAGR